MLKHLSATRHILLYQTKVLQRPSCFPALREGVRHRSVDYERIGSRRPCPPPLPPPVPPPKDDSLFWGLCALAICTTAFAVMAKQNPEVRDWLSIYAPWFDDIIAFVYEENYTRYDFILCKYQALKDKFDDFCGKDECRLDTEGNKITPILEQDVCVKPDPPVVVLDICEIEKCLKELAEESFANIFTAKESCLYYNKLVHDTMLNFSVSKLQTLESAMAERKNLVESSMENYQAINKRLAELLEYFKCGVKAPSDQKESTEKMVQFIKEDSKIEEVEYLWANDKALAYDRLWQIVGETMVKFTKETKTIYSMLDFNSKKPFIDGSIDPFLIHAFKYIKHLKSEIARSQDNITERVDRAVDGILSQDAKDVKARNDMIDNETKKLKGELDKEMQTRLDDLKKKNDERAKRILAKQQLANENEIEMKSQQLENQMESKFEEMLAERMATERKLFKTQRDEVARQLAAIEKILNEHLEAEQETKRCKELWTAGNALLTATKKCDDVVDIAKELKAVAKAGKEDELVGKILKAIPESVRSNGLTPECQVRKKYSGMENVARKVALVEHEGGPLPVYMLSVLQDLMLFLRLSEIPNSEIGKPISKVPSTSKKFKIEPEEETVDVTVMDTFDILQRSRYFMDRGNISQALEYVSALEGASLVATEKWRNSAQAFLETKQAAEAVIAYAAAMGLKNSFI